MKLERVHFHGFGRWMEEEFHFAPGWNVIHAPNEWGKTTLLHGILAILYGLKREGVASRRYLEEYEKYFPWKGNRYSGFIEYSLAEECYRIERDLHKDRERTAVFLTQTGRDITSQYKHDARKERLVLEEQLGLRRGLFEQVTIIRSDGIEEGKMIERLKSFALQHRLETDKKVLVTQQLEEQIRVFDEVVQLHEAATTQIRQLDQELERLRDMVNNVSEVQTAMQRMEYYQKQQEEIQSIYRSEQQVWNRMEDTARAVRETEDRFFRENQEVIRNEKTQEDLTEHKSRIKLQFNRFWGCISLFLVGFGLAPLHQLAGWFLAGIGAVSAGWSGLRIYVLTQERNQNLRWLGDPTGANQSQNKAMKLEEEKKELYISWVEELELDMEQMEEAFEELKEIQKRELERLAVEIQRTEQQLEELYQSFSVQHPREMFTLYQQGKERELQYQYLLKQKGDWIKRLKESEQKLDEYGGIEARQRWENRLKQIHEAKGSLWDPRFEAEAGVTGIRKGDQDLEANLEELALNHVFSQWNSLPLFLDDALVHFDDERLRRSLLYLDNLSGKHQIFYFTGRQKEVEILQDLGIEAYHVRSAKQTNL
jgi:hypothetical protein